MRICRQIQRSSPWRETHELTVAAKTDDDLVEKRCLGQTELRVKPGQMGTSNATKPTNLGTLDYAHLRVPLPADLDRSGIFQKGRDRKHPEAYFLMVSAVAQARKSARYSMKVRDLGTQS